METESIVLSVLYIFRPLFDKGTLNTTSSECVQSTWLVNRKSWTVTITLDECAARSGIRPPDMYTHITGGIKESGSARTYVDVGSFSLIGNLQSRESRGWKSWPRGKDTTFFGTNLPREGWAQRDRSAVVGLLVWSPGS